jgi:uncharacterized membrane protein
MRMKFAKCLGVLSVLIVTVAPLQLLAQSSKYLVINLGDPKGGNNSQGASINDLGWVAGSAALPDNTTQHAMLWFYGYPLDLGTLGGANSTVVFPGINNLGEVVGNSETSEIDPLNETNWSCFAFMPGDGHTCEGFVWRYGKMQALATLGGNNSFAAGVNDAGQVVGWAETTLHDPTCIHPGQTLQFRAVVWNPNGHPTQLPSFHSDPDSAAVAINDKGQVVGVSGVCGNAVGAMSATHGVIWDHGTATSLGDLGGKGWNTPDAINDNGLVVGFTNLTNDPDSPVFHAFMWSKEIGREEDLGAVTGDAISEATSVNDSGEIVGVSYGAGFHNPKAVVWINGVPTDMNGSSVTLVGAQLHLTVANAVNERGAITGTANDADGNVVTFVAIPVR